MPEEYIIDRIEIPVLIDTPPDSIHVLPWRVVIKKDKFTVEVNGETITITDGVNTTKIHADMGLYLSDLLNVFYLL